MRDPKQFTRGVNFSPEQSASLKNKKNTTNDGLRIDSTIAKEKTMTRNRQKYILDNTS